MKKIALYGLLLMIPLYGFWVLPQKNETKDQQKIVADLQSETADYQLKIKQFNDLDKLLSDPKYDGVLERVPSTLEQETFILLLDRIAQSTGFVFDGVSFARGQNAELESSTLEANFSITGRQDKFQNFLMAIEKSPRFLGLSSFNYTVKNINNVDIITMSVPLYTFAQSSEN